MILNETCSALERLHGSRLEKICIDRVVVGISFTGVKLTDGSCAVAYTPADAKHLYRRMNSGHSRKPPPGRLKGVPVYEIIRKQKADALAGAVRVAAMSALSARFINPKRYRLIDNKDALDLLDIRSMKRVCLVGAFGAYIRRLKAITGVKLKVFELRREALSDKDRKFYVPAAKSPGIMRAADMVIITGASIANGTIDGLLKYVRPAAQVVVVGPTSSILPDALFKRGVSMVSGAIIHDADAALETLSEGGSAYHLYGTCAKKVNLFPK